MSTISLVEGWGLISPSEFVVGAGIGFSQVLRSREAKYHKEERASSRLSGVGIASSFAAAPAPQDWWGVLDMTGPLGGIKISKVGL
jgi:hypothetical protein